MADNSYRISETDRKRILRLPSDIAALADRYPSELVNISDSWDEKPFPEGYIPRTIEVYTAEIEDAVISITDNVLVGYIPCPTEANPSSVTVVVDGDFAYIEIEGREIINHIGGAILPKINTNITELLQTIITGKNDD
ncbi:MAG: hypothetical protein RMY64_15085 [Nostoc sp. DedQUE08]|jgi:hypothetical protein|uniref:hypothetical protein n=1 Tax=unclassified Nostoc TaxID=2593658 RepID=UPI002AD4AC68|nr:MULTISPECIES: hypothetical protein [unclassified Nostoc]MBW4426934.1 hypothetical protein [Nostoc desertorum CM1-VF14]MDZ8066923.1 hypothetical protein [Nostoc sp. DedQUE08]MDZ8135837.1 hypothetical protein [Nostoc sp. DedQUE04]